MVVNIQYRPKEIPSRQQLNMSNDSNPIQSKILYNHLIHT